MRGVVTLSLWSCADRALTGVSLCSAPERFFFMRQDNSSQFEAMVWFSGLGI